MGKSFSLGINDIPLSWYMCAREKDIQEEKIPCIYRMFRDLMIREEKECEDWDHEWFQYILSRSL
jgi:hypothetical protein